MSFKIRIFYQKYLFDIPNFEWKDASKTFHFQLSQIIKPLKIKIKFWERTKFEKNYFWKYILGSRHLYSKDRRKDDRKSRTVGKDKNYNKRFQRLESHVVTLARSVAHLSSEMRTQHTICKELDEIR